MSDAPLEVIHATAVALHRRAALITGRAGAGKSTLAIELLALGGALIADDLVALRAGENGALIAAPPPAAAEEAGMIEARGVGLIRSPRRVATAPVAFVVDLDAATTGERLPRRAVRVFAGVEVPVIRVGARPAPALIALMLESGGVIDPDG